MHMVKLKATERKMPASAYALNGAMQAKIPSKLEWQPVFGFIAANED